MSTTLAPSPASLLPFPATAAEEAIRGALAANAADQGAIFDAAGGSSWEPIVDSLVALEALIALESVVGIALKETVVPPGGYEDTEACVADLLAKAARAWARKHGGSGNDR